MRLLAVPLSRIVPSGTMPQVNRVACPCTNPPPSVDVLLQRLLSVNVKAAAPGVDVLFLALVLALDDGPQLRVDIRDGGRASLKHGSQIPRQTLSGVPA